MSARAAILALAFALAACRAEAPPAVDMNAIDEVAAVPADRAPIAPRPVMIGRDGGEADACASLGRVKGDAVSVRAAPSAEAAEADRLQGGDLVAMCDGSAGADWTGVVYNVGGADSPDCGTGSPVASVQPYSGTCRSGWIATRQLETIAG